MNVRYLIKILLEFVPKGIIEDLGWENGLVMSDNKPLHQPKENDLNPLTGKQNFNLIIS